MSDEQAIRDQSHKGVAGVETDAQGRVVRVQLDRQVLDPESPEAVQVPAETIPAPAPWQSLYADGEVSTGDVDSSVKIGDLTEQSLEDTSRSHNPQTQVGEVLAEAKADYDEQQGSPEPGAVAPGESDPNHTSTPSEPSSSDDSSVGEDPEAPAADDSQQPPVE